ncbi:MAG: DNA-directed RNA polymerase subunit omega [Candidatus Aegiribacteria sp.]|nr:DNA-directed RNA polymerase subunit omega [Candidatus Aegiribacteria sp.]MBD3294411.1 DNA-directed RNA polymerase subunit omega [Candidatus Fermentibacteria bacterium]
MSDIYEEIDVMGEQADNQYLLALAIAKRVRTLREGAPSLVEVDNSKRKPFQTAMKEIAEKKIEYTLPRE